MANKVVKGNEKKTPVRGKRHMRKQARRTLAAVLMISAITIAAIPVPETSAAGENASKTNVNVEPNHTAGTSVTVSNTTADGTTFPQINYDSNHYATDTVYVTKDGDFQFVYKYPISGDSKARAILVGCDLGSLGASGELTIPQTVDGYISYNESQGTNFSNVAVDLAGDPLFYKYITKYTYTEETRSSTGQTNTNTVSDAPFVENGSYTLTRTVSEVDIMEPNPDNNNTPEKVGTLKTTIYYTYQYLPCYANNIERWDIEGSVLYKKVATDPAINESTLFVADNDTKTFLNTTNPSLALTVDSGNANFSTDHGGRMVNADVAYVASQFASREQGTNKWKIYESGKQADGTYKGVFSGRGNIQSLIVPESVKGIGKYAFYDCTGLNSVTFDNQIRAIGESAFENCNNMSTLNLTEYASLPYIEKNAFKDCRKLQNVVIPRQTTHIGDGAFMGCTGLRNVDFNNAASLQCIGNDVFYGNTSLTNVDMTNAVALRQVGCHLFRNCNQLQEVIFPPVDTPLNHSVTLGHDGTADHLHISMFQGCSKLGHVKVPNVHNTFVDQEDGSTSSNYRYYVDSFVVETEENGFYFEGYGGSAIHQLAQNNEVAFKYMDEKMNGTYEKVVKCSVISGQPDDVNGDRVDPTEKIKVKFQVDADGQLINVEPLDTANTKFYHLDIPAEVGPYEVTTIGTNFQGNEQITQVNIPETIHSIQAEAFKGCYNLNRVVFEDPLSITSQIGVDAFKTQNVTNGNKTQTEPAATKLTHLTFEGTISADSFPFQYAMNPLNNINNTKQESNVYIDCYGGAPDNLHVKYNPDKQKSELQTVPVFKGEVGNVQASDFDNYEYIRSIAKALTEEERLIIDVDVDANGNPLNTEKCKAWVDAAMNAYLGTPTVEPDNTSTAYVPSEVVTKTVASIYKIDVPTGVHAIKNNLFSSANTPEYLDESNTYDALHTTGNNKSQLSKNTQSVIADASRPILYAVNANAVEADANSNHVVQEITLRDIDELDPYTFYGLKELTTVKMYNSTTGSEVIGDYAFGHCPKLTTVVLPQSTGTMGLRPFAGNRQLTDVKYAADSTSGGSSSGLNFETNEGIIYGTSGGARSSVIECLETRYNKNGVTRGEASVGSATVTAAELAGVTEIKPEAFQNVEGIKTVDLSQSKIVTVPTKCFADDKTTSKQSSLSEVILPATCNSIEAHAFYNTDSLSNVTIPPSVSIIHPFAFDNDDTEVDTYVTVSTTEGSVAAILAQQNAKYYWTLGEKIKGTFTVKFMDEDDNIIDTQLVPEGEDADGDAAAAKLPAKPGYTFSHWKPSVKAIADNVTAIPVYTENAAEKYTVEFWDYDGTVIVTREINPGESAEEPKSPSRTGWTFTGWSKDFTNVTEDKLTDKTNKKLVTIAQYTQNGSSTDPSGSGSSGSGSGSSCSGSDASGSGSGSSGSTSGTSGSNTSGSASGSGANGSAGGSNAGADTTTYTLTVVNGSGSGSYVAGTTVLIAAYPPTKGYTFNKWTSTDQTTTFANMMASATSITMPAKSITVTANYTNGSGATTSSRASNTGSSTGSVSGNNSTGGNRKTNTGNGTTVDVTKDGISDKNVASATVSGSTDNFVVKVKEDSDALEKVIRALKKQYGDISNFRYVAMDISLYDSTGTKQITDTAGLAVTVTLPLPDELRQYAGNNKVAGVVGEDTLDMLSPTFSTIDDVPCVTFTATHFSPYTIYVDTANLSSGVSDATPKTGDLLQPKWFLSFGLGLLSIVLFLKKDKKQVLA